MRRNYLHCKVSKDSINILNKELPLNLKMHSYFKVPKNFEIPNNSNSLETSSRSDFNNVT